MVLARELQDRGHHVILAGTPTFLRDPTVVDRDEFEIYPLADFEAEEGLEIFRKVRKTPSKRFLNEQIQAELKMLDHLRPAVVVNDFHLTLYISARLRRIPLISLLGGRWIYQYTAKPLKASRTHPFYPILKRILGEKGTDFVIPPFQRWALRYKMRPLYHLAQKYGLAPKKELWDLLIEKYNLVWTGIKLSNPPRLILGCQWPPRRASHPLLLLKRPTKSR